MMEMPLTKIAAENFTVFEDIKIPFCEGLNVLVGENGVGKTHIMKLAYAACQASKHDVSFSQKTTMLFRPDQSGIGRLVNRGKSGSNKAMVSVESDTAKIGMTFSAKHENGMQRLIQKRNGKSRCLISQAYLFRQKRFCQMPGIWMLQ